MEIKKLMGEAMPVSGRRKGIHESSKGLDFRKLLEEANLSQKGDSLTIFQSPAGDIQKELICPSLLSLEVNPVSRNSNCESNPPVEQPSIIFNGVIGASAQEEFTRIKSQSVEVFEETLKILEQYQQAIGNPEFPLKKIEPIINALSQELENLNRLSAPLSSSDPLKQMMAEAGIVSAVEIGKFRRGEYV